MREYRKKMSLCRDCGGEKDNSLTLCSLCRKKTYERIKKLDKRKFEENRCNIGTCKNKRLSNNRLCEYHRLKDLKEEKERDLKLIGNGLCTACGSEKYMDSYKESLNTRSKFCQTCYLKTASSRHFNTVQKWKELLDILIKQNYICPYSGDIIVLGINDSVDHILPQGKYPEKSKEITNIQWVSRKINKMKNDNTDKEFIEFITIIYKHIKKMEREKKSASSLPIILQLHFTN